MIDAVLRKICPCVIEFVPSFSISYATQIKTMPTLSTSCNSERGIRTLDTTGMNRVL